MEKLTVIDYGMGNLLSVKRAFEHCGGTVVVTDSPEDIGRASKLVLPGVGAFKDGMEELKKRRLIDAIKTHCTEDKPFLGICLGMQMMLNTSHEFGMTSGLGVIPGEVLPLPDKDGNGIPHKIPHIGWSRIEQTTVSSWAGSILDTVPPLASFYFVHSFYAAPLDSSHTLAECDYNGIRFAAALRAGNVYGCQFHPEKSGPDGLSILSQFISL